MTTLHLDCTNGRRLAYRQSDGRSGLTFVWLSGFKSDMTGTKVMELEAWAEAEGHGFFAFDYSGHGESAGAFENGTITTWREDALQAIEQCTRGPLVLVGSSMGGWMALLSMLALKDRVDGLVLIAPAPDFTDKLMWPEFDESARADIMEKGVFMRPSEYGDPYPITRALIEDGRQWNLLDKPIPFEGPVRILQGREDPDVPWEHAFRLVEAMTAEDLVFHLIKDGDHRLSRPQDIKRLKATCAEIADIVSANG
ncbi:alpha/beta hydrolase [Henriciella aquimarina]|uniref:alpha/beta hydrolase n=1 Tax=Henriciella aquimarina TaxID=545261 RepID=UPI000A06375B|nr:alpha/beta hydrolase [Henriciella aquimarina]